MTHASTLFDLSGHRAGGIRGIADDYGHIDILVNNAGISWGAKAEEMPLDKWHTVLDVNLTGAFLLCQSVGRHMIERLHGRIVNVAWADPGAGEMGAVQHSSERHCARLLCHADDRGSGTQPAGR